MTEQDHRVLLLDTLQEFLTEMIALHRFQSQVNMKMTKFRLNCGSDFVADYLINQVIDIKPTIQTDDNDSDLDLRERLLSIEREQGKKAEKEDSDNKRGGPVTKMELAYDLQLSYKKLLKNHIIGLIRLKHQLDFITNYNNKTP